MKKRIAVDLLFSVQEVRQVVAILTGECPTDEQINEWFFDGVCPRIDASGMLGKEVSTQLCLVMVSLLCQSKEDEKPKPKKSAFRERVDQMMKDRQFEAK